MDSGTEINLPVLASGAYADLSVSEILAYGEGKTNEIMSTAPGLDSHSGGG